MKKIDFLEFTKMTLNLYSYSMVKSIRENNRKPSYKKQIEFKKLYGIPHEFWIDVRSNLINIPKRGRKRKDRE
ncbi:hypothetical protein [Campylobacter molothri]|uniref:Uncharacterized protein n=1 Tax=Campylobacter molothri TaxID=1032242 RepID=A0ACC5W1Q6_9BACT|nr:hypothetical protein [Campylobacter sp. RM9939]MBZ7974606.1 hypothetical protein [Campylobacter sp. RM9754]